MTLKRILSRIMPTLIVCICVIAGGLFLFGYNMHGVEIIEEIESPDGRYVAIIFEANSGATSKFIYRLSILKKGKTISNWDSGNTYISTTPFKVRWKTDKELFLNSKFEDRGPHQVFKQKAKIHGITIRCDYVGVD